MKGFGNQLLRSLVITFNQYASFYEEKEVSSLHFSLHLLSFIFFLFFVYFRVWFCVCNQFYPYTHYSIKIQDISQCLVYENLQERPIILQIKILWKRSCSSFLFWAFKEWKKISSAKILGILLKNESSQCCHYSMYM